MSRFIKALAAAILLSSSAGAQVIVNEFCFANYSDYNLGGEFEDWVELYNPGGVAVNISGFWLSDNLNNPMKWDFPAGSIVPANGYLLVLVSGHGDYDPGYLGMLNTNFKVTQTDGEELVFSNASGTVLESYDFDVISPNQQNQSWGRTPNGSANWAIQTNPSQLAVNSGTTAIAYAASPSFSLESGYYSAPISLTLSTTEPAASIRYTLNGNTPTTTSTLYTGPITISTTTVVRAATFSSNGSILRSFISVNTYFFGADQHSLFVFSVSGNTIGDGSWPWWGASEQCHLEMFLPGGVFAAEAYGDSNEHGNDSNAYGQRGFDYIARDALGYDNEMVYPVFHHSDRTAYERLIFKAAANDNYPFSGDGAHIRDSYVSELSILGDLKLDERKTESCIVYLNGVYWGVYEVREKVDDIDYTDHYYDQPEGFVDYLKTWGGTWADLGDGADWYTLVNFITTNDMTVQANYDYVLTQYNTHSLIDYFVLNGYVVCTDWLNWNTSWWRGRHPLGDARRWRYSLWDNDATFGHYINYTGVNSTAPDADPCQVETLGDLGGQGHIPVLNALFNNDDFFADYIQRYAAHSNTIFSCERMIEVLDSMVAVIAPEMPRQTVRWGGSVAGWNANVQALRDYILSRCNDEIISGIEDCYDVTAFDVTVQVQGTGSIDLMDIELDETSSPWSGVFFGGLSTDIEANVDANGLTDDCTEFVGWSIVSGTGTIGDPALAETSFSFSSDVTLQAEFQPSTDPIILTADVIPAGAGAVSMDGFTPGAYPANQTYTSGDQVDLMALPAANYEFVGWQSANGTLLMDATLQSNLFFSCYGDSITAVFQFSSLMPVTWLAFDAIPDGGTVECRWSTAMELNNDYFTVERSADGILWSPLAEVDATGSAVSPASYVWTDREPLHGHSYYRIRQYDLNGESSVSVIRAVQFSTSGSWSLFPNPATGAFFLRGPEQMDRLTVMNAQGAQVDVRSTGPGRFELTHPVPGMYIVEVTARGSSRPERIKLIIE